MTMRKLLFAAALIGLTPLVALAGNPVENSYGITGSTSGTVTIRTLTGTYNFNLPIGPGAVGQPLLSGGGGSASMDWGTRSGNTTIFATSTGILTPGNCVKIDASGNFQDAGAACDAGTSSSTITSIVAGTGLNGGGTTGTVTVNLTTPVTVPNGGTGLSSGTSGGIPAYTGASTITSSGVLTANVPILGGGAGGVPTSGSRSGNTTTFATTSGTFTSGHCASMDASGNVVDAGAACGTGVGTAPSRLTNTTSVGNGADLTEDNLQTLTLAGGTMSTGSYLRLIAAGHFTGSTDLKTAKLIVGTQTLCTVSASSLTITQWQIEATFVATGSSTNVTAARCWSGAGSSSMTNAQLGPTPSTNLGITLSSDVTIKTSGRNNTASTANTIVSDILIMEYFP